jgi:hypothetical protein
MIFPHSAKGWHSGDSSDRAARQKSFSGHWTWNSCFNPCKSCISPKCPCAKKHGGSITIDAHQLILQLNVPDTEIAQRRAAWQPPAPRYKRGVQAKFAHNASSASKGAVLDLF